jgi:HD-GYP domain-containing protein (c-di-GMP phosphodiesterase class II)
MEGATGTPACVVYAGRGAARDVCDSSCRPADELLVPGAAAAPAVLLADTALAERINDPRAVPEHVVIVAADEGASASLGRRAEHSLAGVADAAARRAIVDAACHAAVAQFTIGQFEGEFHQLSRIGIELMREHDRKALLRMIVAQCKKLTFSDGGGLLLVNEDEEGKRWLRAVLYAFDSIDGEFIEPSRRVAVDDSSIIGRAALFKQPIVVADAYDLPRDAMFDVGVAFDEEFDYRRRSMLLVPLLDQLGRVLGVLLCVNRKTDPNARIHTKEDADRHVIEYSHREVRLVRMLAGQAAIAIENARLYAQVENAFESFVRAAVSAIDLRDPATAGHSVRVAKLVTTLAEDVERKESGPYRDVRFSPEQMRALRFAALLHDVGKIAVPESLLLKAKKLPAGGWERIDARFDLIRRTIELESCRTGTSSSSSRGHEAELAIRLSQLEHYRDVVRIANEPSVLDAPVAAELLVIAQRTFERPDGSVAPYLTPEEVHYLQLPKGTLDDRERVTVEGHVTASRDLLSDIPWTDDLKGLVTYAYGHHELLNGDGYPQQLAGDEIPLQTRLITVADIFDALTASDRPYKPAVSVERALEMLQADAAAGQLDPELVKIMVESESDRRHAARRESEPTSSQALFRVS